MFYSSVLYWNATRLMAEMATATGDHKLATTMRGEAERVRSAATKILWNDELGVFMASTGLEKLNVDIWGNAMAGAKNAFFGVGFIVKTIFLPRQARDKQAYEKLKTKAFSSAGAMGFTTPAQASKIFKYFQVNEEKKTLNRSIFLNFSYYACPEPVLAK
eukprot:COSAG06_NODE_237_length_19433_cov_92.613961_19_plen_160_part_00